ncbi:MAG: squalene-associated FAD-dependent desaturase [Chthonomonadales bacterium]|nr:squalene-associated FAD-dependent desaturase [Chthonomonadales bacterium]
MLDCPEALAVLDRETEWIFHKNLNFDQPKPSEGSYLSIVISASHRLAGLPKEEILATVLSDIHACLPDSREATLLRSQIIRWPKATISPKPGADALRPTQTSPISNLLVAGEWTQTGWPSTMEGAARSGYLAAEAILTAEGKPESLLAPDLPRPTLARLLASR